MAIFNKKYFVIAVVMFIVEVFIAVFIQAGFVRSYLGDVFVVILIYCFIKAFLNAPVVTVVIWVLLFSFTLEFLQFFRVVARLGLQQSVIARTVIGTSFAWNDLIAYLAGIAIILVGEKYSGTAKEK